MKFSELKQAFTAEINRPARDAETHPFSELAVRGFSVAVEMVKSRHSATPGAFVRNAANLMATVEAWKPLDTKDNWSQWPREPRTFGRYHRAGDSALHTAVMFTESITGVIQIAKVLTIGVVTLDDMEVSDLSGLLAAFTSELENRTIPTLDRWSMPEIHRDSEMLIRQAMAESRASTNSLDDNESQAVTVDQLVELLRLSGSRNSKSRSAVEGWTRRDGFPPPLTKKRPKTYRFKSVKKWVMKEQAIEIQWPESQVI